MSRYEIGVALCLLVIVVLIVRAERKGGGDGV